MTACAKLAVLGGLALASAAGGTAAQQPTQAQASAIRQSCRSDYQAHCADVPTGGTAALQCLRNNMANLSQGCHAAVAAVGGGAAAPAGGPPTGGATPMGPMRGRMMGLRQACGGDYSALCRGLMPGGGRALQCLADHQESLSEPCRAALAEARGAR